MDQIPTDLGKREDAEVDEGRFVMLDPVYAQWYIIIETKY